MDPGDSVRLRSNGSLRYFEGFKVNVEVDPGIVQLARALVPRHIRLQHQRYAPHITVVRNEVPPDLTAWALYEGASLEFEYEPHVHDDGTYFWLRAFCTRLIEIRLELGLLASSGWSRGPDGFDSFHITIGNRKG